MDAPHLPEEPLQDAGSVAIAPENVLKCLPHKEEEAMARENLSRRRFLSDVAAGSTGAALATMPGVLTATDAGLAPAAPATMESYPIVEAGKARPPDPPEKPPREGRP